MIILLFQTISRFGKRGDDESFVNLQNPSDDSRMGKRGKNFVKSYKNLIKFYKKEKKKRKIFAF